jgi:hypothetical protein
MNHIGDKRQTDEIISVICPHPLHSGDVSRDMKKNCYYGSLQEPYLQMCGSCAQYGKIISEEQKEAISKTLSGRKLAPEHVEKILAWRAEHPEWADKTKLNLIPGMGGITRAGMPLPPEWKQAISDGTRGIAKTEEHRQNISEGRKKMLAETGGFTREHREKLSQATHRNYEKGFDPKKYHRKGWHSSPKAGEVFFHSSYEKRAYILLDRDDDVSTYNAESVRVLYYNPQKKITGTYLVDIEVHYKNGSIKLIEIKPQAWLQDEVVVAKHDAAEIYASEHNAKFEVWSEIELFGPVYDERKIRNFIEQLDSSDRKEKKKSDNLQRSKKHYDEKIATDTVSVWCDYCQETHQPLRLTYDKNIARNGEYICERRGGFIAGSKPKKKKENPHAEEGKKQCNECKEIKLFNEFGVDKLKNDGYSTRCKICRSNSAKNKYNKKAKIQMSNNEAQRNIDSFPEGASQRSGYPPAPKIDPPPHGPGLVPDQPIPLDAACPRHPGFKEIEPIVTPVEPKTE